MKKKKAKTVGVDLDDVLMNFNEALSVWHNREYKTSYAREDVKDFVLGGLWKCSFEESVRRISEFYQSSDHFHAEPVMGAVEGIRDLKKEGHILHIITSKPESLREKTLEWLERHFPGMFSGVHFTNHYHDTHKKITKGEVCRELGIEIFVDDSLEHAKDVSGAGIPVLLFDTPWNQGNVISEGPIARVRSWAEIAEKIKN